MVVILIITNHILKLSLIVIIGYLGMIIKASSHLTVIVSILHTSGRVVVLGARRSLMSSIVDGNVSCMGQLLTT